MAYPHEWSPISCRSSAGQGKFAGQRPTFYHWATPPTTPPTRNTIISNTSNYFCAMWNTWKFIERLQRRMRLMRRISAFLTKSCQRMSRILRMHHWSTASVRCISALLPSIQIHRAVSTTQNSMLVALPISVTAVEVSNSVKYTN